MIPIAGLILTPVHVRQWSQLYGLEVWRMIRNMREREMSIKSIARELSISRSSVRTYL